MRLNSPPPSSLPSSPLLSSPSPSGGQRRLLLLLHEYIKTHSLSSSLPPGAARRRSSTSSRSSALLLLQVPRRQATGHTLACTERPCYLDPSWRAASRCPALNLASVPQTARIPNSHCKYAYVPTCTRARTLSLPLRDVLPSNGAYISPVAADRGCRGLRPLTPTTASPTTGSSSTRSETIKNSNQLSKTLPSALRSSWTRNAQGYEWDCPKSRRCSSFPKDRKTFA